MARKLALQLTIRQRFFLGMLFFTVSLTIVGALSFYDLVQIKDLTALVGEVQQLNNALLETRRFEKNYLLYGNPEDLTQARTYLEQAKLLVTDVTAKRRKAAFQSIMRGLGKNLEAYSQSLDNFETSLGNGNPPSEKQISQIREHGKKMVRQAEGLMGAESNRILDIIDTLKVQLIFSVLAALALGAIVAIMMFGRLFNTLSIIQTATHRISQGVFEPLNEVSGQSDMNTIVKALNAMVRELELRQAQLLQAQKLSSIGTLTAGVAHQLNNPLNNISTSSQILLEEIKELDPDFLHKMLGNIEGESRRAKEIVQGLLEFSREREFTLTLESLHIIIKKTVRLVSSQIPGNVELHTDVPEDIRVRMDTQHFQEALLNLIINAVHAIEPDPGTISIEARKEGDEVAICVSDTGRGIPEHVKARIFDPFFTTKDEGDGTGLGLSIVYGIVEKHGGKITVDSEENAGTTFIIRLPARAAE